MQTSEVQWACFTISDYLIKNGLTSTHLQVGTNKELDEAWPKVSLFIIRAERERLDSLLKLKKLNHEQGAK